MSSNRAGTQIPSFHGRNHKRQRFVAISFPGAFEEEWNYMTAEEETFDEEQQVSVACVFFPDGDPKYYGEHGRNCQCKTLYEKNNPDAYKSWSGGRAPFGCLWYKKWCENVGDVIDFEQVGIIVYKPDKCGDNMDGLGYSQRGEVAYANKQEGLKLFSVDLDGFFGFVVPAARKLDEFLERGRMSSDEVLALLERKKKVWLAEEAKKKAEQEEKEKEKAKKKAEQEQKEKEKAEKERKKKAEEAGGMAGAAASSVACAPSQRPSKRTVDIQLVGSTGVGKTKLLETLIKAEDEAQLGRFADQKDNLLSHHEIRIGQRLVRLLDCSGNLRAEHLVRDWFSKSVWVFLVYSTADAKSLEYALELAKVVSRTGAKLLLLGNKHVVEQGQGREVDVMRAKDAAIHHEGFAIVTSRLIDAVKVMLNADEAGGMATSPQAGGMAGAAAPSVAPAPSQRMSSKPTSNRRTVVDIQLVGSTGVGKTMLLETLIKAEDEAQLGTFNDNKDNLFSHYDVKIGERRVRLLDCTGRSGTPVCDRAQLLVREWFRKSAWVFVVYNTADSKSLEHALELAKEVSQTGAKFMLFGNKYNVEQGQGREVDVMRAKDAAIRHEGFAIVTSRLIDAVKAVLNADEVGGMATSPQVGGMAGAAAPSVAPAPSQRMSSKPTSNRRTVDIQLVGSAGVGKTMLLKTLIKAEDEAQLGRFDENKGNLLAHYDVQIGERRVRLLDCTGDHRAERFVQEWFSKSVWVFVVYNAADAKRAQRRTLDYAIELQKSVFQSGAKLLRLGNTHDIEQGQGKRVAPRSGRWVEAEMDMDKGSLIRHEGVAIETSRLIDAVNLALNGDEAKDPALEDADDGGSPAGNTRSPISAAVGSVKSWFGGAADWISGRAGHGSAGHEKCLRSSKQGTKAMKMARCETDTQADLQAVQEPHESAESAVTCMVFGQERLHRSYILLAAGSRDGAVVIYRCDRTGMELEMLDAQEGTARRGATSFASSLGLACPTRRPASAEGGGPPDGAQQNIHVHRRLEGHTRAVTSISFNTSEDQLVTTSIDCSVRFWCIESSVVLKIFSGSFPVPVALCHPRNPEVFVVASSTSFNDSSNGILRLTNISEGNVLQKLKIESEVRALTFDGSGMHLLAGTKSGIIHVLECSEENVLKAKIRAQVFRAGITYMRYVPGRDGAPPAVLVNAQDSSVAIVDLTYGPAKGVLTDIAVRHRVHVPHTKLPLKCTYSPSGQGYLISGSEDSKVYIVALGKGQNYKTQWLERHRVPVVAVAVNNQDTLLASADSVGRIIIWRRMDYSHLPD